jgi:hypothetical protein
LLGKLLRELDKFSSTLLMMKLVPVNKVNVNEEIYNSVNFLAFTNIGNSTVETGNSGTKKSRNLQVISGLGCPRRSKLSIHNEKFQVSAEIP